MYEAVLTHDTEFFGAMDPFVEIKTPWETKQSRTLKSGGKKPKWNQFIDLDIQDASKHLTIIVWDDEGKKGDHDLVSRQLHINDCVVSVGWLERIQDPRLLQVGCRGIRPLVQFAL